MQKKSSSSLIKEHAFGQGVRPPQLPLSLCSTVGHSPLALALLSLNLDINPDHLCLSFAIVLSELRPSSPNSAGGNSGSLFASSMWFGLESTNSLAPGRAHRYTGNRHPAAISATSTQQLYCTLIPSTTCTAYMTHGNRAPPLAPAVMKLAAVFVRLP